MTRADLAAEYWDAARYLRGRPPGNVQILNYRAAMQGAAESWAIVGSESQHVWPRLHDRIRREWNKTIPALVIVPIVALDPSPNSPGAA